MKKNQQPATGNQQLSFWHPASLVSTCFGIGKIPFAPGTWGSLFGVGLMAFFFYLGEAWCLLYILLSIPLLSVLGFVTTRKYLKHTISGDPKEVVIDEVLGVTISYIAAFISWDLFDNYKDIDKVLVDNTYLEALFFFLPFLFFRFFDIVKPGPVGWADRNVKGAWGVMLDDIIAGVLAGICSALVFLVV